METPDSKVAEFKQRVEKEWAGDETAVAWQKYYPQMKEQLAQVTKALVDAARVGNLLRRRCDTYMRRLAVKPDPDGPSPMRFAEPGKLARLIEAAGFRDVKETSLNLPAPYRGSPEELLASMMEIAAPFRNAAATLSEDDQRAAQREVYENLPPLYDGTFTKVTAPVLIVTGVSS